jgi:hypothetical protein
VSEPLSIKLFLVKGSSSGLRTAEISNWSGKAIACSRKELDELSKREEASRPGVYFLIGNDADTGEPSAYVGIGEKVGRRLNQQQVSKDFWTQVVAFVSKDENLTQAHIKYLEGKLIDLGLQAGKGVIQNNQSSGARLPESDQAEMDIFLDRILRLLPIMGTSLFSMPTAHGRAVKNRLLCKTKGLIAYGNRTESGFLVYKGSQAVIADRPAAVLKKGGHYLRRKSLVNKGVLVEEDGGYVFTRDYEFTSPSLAAGAISGGSANGLTMWKTEKGKTLKEIESADS